MRIFKRLELKFILAVTVFVLCFFMQSILTSANGKEIDIEPFAVGNPLYPGTFVEMQPGDVLYSHKTSWSSFFVGHVGIVGEDFKIYHVNSVGTKAHKDTLKGYMNRHENSEKITVLRDSSPRRLNAARWAKNNIYRVDSYSFNWSLDNVSSNYCSKFVWQAFYYGNANLDILGKGYKASQQNYIYPSEIYNALNINTYFYAVK